MSNDYLLNIKKVLENNFNRDYDWNIEVDINYFNNGGDNNMKIEQFKDVTIAYMRNIGEYGVKNQELMEDFKRYLSKNNLMDDNVTIFGVALDNPEKVSANELRYDVGIIVNELNMLPELSKRKLDDAKYAIFEIQHTEKEIKEFWLNIPKLCNEINIDFNKPILERYNLEKIKNHLCEFCVPLIEDK